VPLQTIIQTSFAAGVLSPRMRGRVDLQQYPAGAEDLTNVLVQSQGGATKRGGSYFVTAPRTNARVRLVPFIVSSAVAYVLEMGDNYMRILRNRALLTDGAAALEIATPYFAAELRELKFAQSADVMYVFHPNHQPRRITRGAGGAWSIAPVVFSNGPYDTENTGDVGAALPGSTASLGEGATTGGSTGGSGVGDGPDPVRDPGDGGEGPGGEASGGDAGGGEAGGEPDGEAGGGPGGLGEA